MAFRNFLIPLGYTQFCVVRGKVSLPGFDEGTGELRLRYHAKKSQYLIDAYKQLQDIGRWCVGMSVF